MAEPHCKRCNWPIAKHTGRCSNGYCPEHRDPAPPKPQDLAADAFVQTLMAIEDRR